MKETMENEFHPINFVNKQVRNIPPSGIRRFFDSAATMEDVISLGVGEPDFVTPWHIRSEAVKSLRLTLACNESIRTGKVIYF